MTKSRRWGLDDFALDYISLILLSMEDNSWMMKIVPRLTKCITGSKVGVLLGHSVHDNDEDTKSTLVTRENWVAVH